MKKILTLGYLIKENEICLAMKKRGFGEGNWNGYGGKIEEDETIEEAAVREIHEEAEVVVQKEDLEKVAVNEFFFTDGKHLEVHAYFVRTWIDEPTETEEMKPEWFTYSEIPFAQMWADDIDWLPRALAGEKLLGKVWFKEDEKTIERMEWNSVSAL
jgi:ADP-ribose pyrophosphatase YjhB (NUDIX family)